MVLRVFQTLQCFTDQLCYLPQPALLPAPVHQVLQVPGQLLAHPALPSLVTGHLQGELDAGNSGLKKALLVYRCRESLARGRSRRGQLQEYSGWREALLLVRGGKEQKQGAEGGVLPLLLPPLPRVWDVEGGQEGGGDGAQY